MEQFKSQIVGIVIGLLLGLNLCVMWYVNSKINAVIVSQKTTENVVNQVVQYLSKTNPSS